MEPGTPHQPFNPTDTEVVIASDMDTPAMPQSFGACLDDICNSRLPEAPAVVQFGMKWLVLPFARLWGYRNYYPEFSLHWG